MFDRRALIGGVFEKEPPVLLETCGRGGDDPAKSPETVFFRDESRPGFTPKAVVAEGRTLGREIGGIGDHERETESWGKGVVPVSLTEEKAPAETAGVLLGVVKSLATDPVAGSTVTTNYQYGGACADRGGRGFLGFSTRTVTNSLGYATVSDYAMGFPYTGLVTSVRQTGPGGILLGSTTNTLAQETAGTGAVFPYVSQSVEVNSTSKCNFADGPSGRAAVGSWFSRPASRRSTDEALHAAHPGATIPD